MKSSILITAAIAALALFGATSSAEARSRHKHSKSYVYVSGHRSCGTPIYTERYLVGYDRCGYPVWGYRTVERYCPPPPRRVYYNPPVVYPQPQPCYDGYRRGGVVISGTFRL